MGWLRRFLALTTRGVVLVGLAAANAVVIWRFGVRAKLFAPPDAITAQFAFWPSVFAGIVEQQWGATRAGHFVATLWRLDFVFPLLYASFLRGLYVWLSARLGSPTRRLNSRATRSGSVAARRWAASPTTKPPSCCSATTVGTADDRVPRDTIAGGALPRATAAAVNVVPRSTPTT